MTSIIAKTPPWPADPGTFKSPASFDALQNETLVTWDVAPGHRKPVELRNYSASTPAGRSSKFTPMSVGNRDGEMVAVDGDRAIMLRALRNRADAAGPGSNGSYPQILIKLADNSHWIVSEEFYAQNPQNWFTPDHTSMTTGTTMHRTTPAVEAVSFGGVVFDVAPEDAESGTMRIDPEFSEQVKPPATKPKHLPDSTKFVEPPPEPRPTPIGSRIVTVKNTTKLPPTDKVERKLSHDNSDEINLIRIGGITIAAAALMALTAGLGGIRGSKLVLSTGLWAAAVGALAVVHDTSK